MMRNRFYVFCLALMATLMVQAQELVRTEYFIDTDPGYGNAASVSTPLLGLNSIELDLDGVQPGAHLLCLRTVDSNGRWSATTMHPILVKGPDNDGTVARIEYFFDSDPGYGQGRSAENPTTGESQYALSVDGLTQGAHMLFIRATDNQGRWSEVTSKSIFVINNGRGEVSRIEYFFDTDPGFGQATAIENPQNGEANYALSIDGLSQGAHTLYLRAADDRGIWSSVTAHPLYVCGPTTGIAALEYFFDDNDPGEGQATQVTLPENPLEQFVFSADASALAEGDHTLNVRAKGTDGIWRLISNRIFAVTTSVPGESEPYAVLSDSSKVLTFYYDDQKTARGGMSVGPFTRLYYDDVAHENKVNGRGWDNTVTSVVFDESFANCTTLTSTAYWFFNCSNLTSITNIEYLKSDNVTDMNNMFCNCRGLTSLNVTNFKTENVTDMGNMFYVCSGLTSLDVTNFKTENVTNMAMMFFGCSGLTSLDVTNFKTDNVTDMSYMFDDCRGLTSLDVTSFKTDNVTDMSHMFSSCSGLTSLDVTNFKTDNVTDMGAMFAGCSGLTSLDVTSFKTDNVTKMNSMFVECSGLTSLDVSNFQTDNVTDMSDMFNNCRGLTSLDVTSFNTENVTNMNKMFEYCSGLTSLDVTSFKTDKVTEISYMFEGCSGLTSLDVSSFKTDNVTNLFRMFASNPNLKTIYASSDWNTAAVQIGSDMFIGCTNLVGGMGTVYDADHTDYTYAHIDGGESNPGYFTDKNAAGPAEPYAVLSDNNTVLTFYYDDQKVARGGMDVGPFTRQGTRGWNQASGSITTVVFDESFANCTSITSTSWWFSMCSKLTTVEGLANLNTSSVTDMGNMFFGCSSLTSLDLSSFNTSNVTYMDGMFRGCSALTDVDLTSFETENLHSTNSLFYECESLKTVDLSSFSTPELTDAGYMFFSCSELTTIYASDLWSTEKTTTSDLMFSYCNNLVGGNGTVFTTEHTDKEYARIDREGQPGYFTEKVAETYGRFLYFIGSTDGWVKSEQRLASPEQDGKYTGFVYIANPDGGDLAFKFLKVAGNWEAQLNSNNVATVLGDFDKGVDNFVANQGEGVYYVEVDLTASTMTGTKINNMNIVGSFDDWDPTDNNMQMTWDADNYCYVITGTAVSVGTYGWKFAANNGWDINLGTRNENIDDLVLNGANITVPGDIIKLYPTRNVSDNIYCTVEDSSAEPYAVLTDNDVVLRQDSTGVVYGKTLTFYYDGQKAARGGMDVRPFGFNSERGWHEQRGNITTVVVDESMSRCTTLTSISGWFTECSNLTTVTGIENLNTSNVVNMGGMFAYCTSLTSLDLRSLNTSNVVLMDAMFRGCSNLTTLDVSSFNTENARDMSFMFAECPVLVSIDVSNFNTANVTDMYCMFYECNALTSLDLSGFNTENVTRMRGMFRRCLSLSSLDLSNFNTANVTDMYEMFAGCSSLTSLDVSSFNTENVESMGYLFNGCRSLRTLDLSSFDVSKITNMDGMFTFCSELTTITVERDWDTSNVTSTGSVFYACNKLVGGMGTVYDANHIDHTYAHIDGGTANPGYFTDKNAPAPVGDMAYAVLSNNNTVLTFYYDDQMQARGGMSVGPFTYTYDGTYITDVVRPGWFGQRESITRVIFDASFANCTSLTSTAFWFYRCNNLTTITGIEHLKTDNVTDMGFMFDGCSSLTSLDISGFNTSNVERFCALFAGCSSLTSIDVSHFNTSNAWDFRLMFSQCSSLTELDVSHFNTQKATGMGGMFQVCSKLTKLDLHNFNTENVFGMGWMFTGCSSLLDLDISGFNTSSAGEMFYMFDECPSLASIMAGNAVIPDSIYAQIENPNLLVYVNSEATAPTIINNVVVNGVARNIVLTDALTGYGNFNCPQAFRAEHISYRHNFQQETQPGVSRGWEGIALPFNVQTITHEHHGALHPFGTPEEGYPFWLRQLTPNGIVQAVRMIANRPYIISMPNSQAYHDEYNQSGWVTFAANDVTVPVTTTMVTALADSSIVMIPTMQRVEQATDVYAINRSQPYAGYPEGSIFVSNLREVRPFEAYTEHRSASPAPMFYPIDAWMDGGTGIDEMENELLTIDNAYNLNGQRVKTPRKGVFIVNGRKTVVK